MNSTDAAAAGPIELLQSPDQEYLHPEEAGRLRAEWLERLGDEDAKLIIELSALNSEAEAVSMEEEATRGDVSWSDSLHQRFLKVVKAQSHAEAKGGRERLLRQLGRELPGVPAGALALHYETWRRLKAVKDRRRAATLAWNRNRALVISQATAAFEAAHAHAKQVAERERALDQQREICQQWHEQLAEMRVRHQEMQKEAERRKAEIERLEAAAAASKSRRQREEAERAAERVRAWREEQAALAAEMREKELELEDEVRQIAEETARFNEQRVTFRKHQEQQKLEDKRRLEEERRAAAEERAARLNRLVEQVTSTLDVTEDPKRVMRPTVAQQLAAEADDEVGPLFRVDGYNMNQVSSPTTSIAHMPPHTPCHSARSSSPIPRPNSLSPSAMQGWIERPPGERPWRR